MNRQTGKEITPMHQPPYASWLGAPQRFMGCLILKKGRNTF